MKSSDEPPRFSLSANLMQPRPNRLRLAATISFLVAITLLAFAPVFRAQFVHWDDQSYVQENEHVTGGLTWAGVVWAFTKSHSANWHPLTWISHMLDVQLFGVNAPAHHAVNLALHIANTLLLFLLLNRITGRSIGDAVRSEEYGDAVESVPTGFIWRSAIVAALFALHPLHVESVAWISERKDVLSGFSFMLTLLAYAKYVESRKQKAEIVGKFEARNPKSETSSETSTFKTQTSEKVQNSNIKPEREPTEPGSRIRNSAAAPRSTVHGPHSSWPWYVLALVLFALGLMSKPMLVTMPCVLLLLDFWPLGRLFKPGRDEQPARRGLLVPTGLRWLIIEKIPFFVLSAVSSVITYIVQQKQGAVADLHSLPIGYRLETALIAYVEYIGKFVLPAKLSPMYPLPSHWPVWEVLFSTAILLLLTAAAWFLRKRRPYAIVGWLWFLGMLVPVIGLVHVGSQAYADRYMYLPMIGLLVELTWLTADLARNTARRFLPCSPTALRASRGAGIVAALTLIALCGYRTRAQTRIWHDTETLFSGVLTSQPNNVQALNGLGEYLVDTGRVAEGKPLLEKAVQIQPSFVEALGALADAELAQGRFDKAVEHYQAALRVQPNNSAVLNNLAWLQTVCPNPAFRDSAEAVRLARRACEVTGYSKPVFIGTLAAAQAQAGNFQAAIEIAERAASLADSLNQPAMAARNRELVKLYQEGKGADGKAPEPAK
jgi:protein O-mannosyl-transferase